MSEDYISDAALLRRIDRGERILTLVGFLLSILPSLVGNLILKEKAFSWLCLFPFIYVTFVVGITHLFRLLDGGSKVHKGQVFMPKQQKWFWLLLGLGLLLTFFQPPCLSSDSRVFIHNDGRMTAGCWITPFTTQKHIIRQLDSIQTTSAQLNQLTVAFEVIKPEEASVTYLYRRVGENNHEIKDVIKRTLTLTETKDPSKIYKETTASLERSRLDRFCRITSVTVTFSPKDLTTIPNRG